MTIFIGNVYEIESKMRMRFNVKLMAFHYQINHYFCENESLTLLWPVVTYGSELCTDPDYH